MDGQNRAWHQLGWMKPYEHCLINHPNPTDQLGLARIWSIWILNEIALRKPRAACASVWVARERGITWPTLPWITDVTKSSSQHLEGTLVSDSIPRQIPTNLTVSAMVSFRGARGGFRPSTDLHRPSAGMEKAPRWIPHARLPAGGSAARNFSLKGCKGRRFFSQPSF